MVGVEPVEEAPVEEAPTDLYTKKVKNGQSLKCHHVKSISPTGFRFYTHCNDGQT